MLRCLGPNLGPLTTEPPAERRMVRAWPKFSLAGLGRRPRFLPSTYLEVACAEMTVPIATSTFGCWGEQNETDFADVKSCLPGRLAIHREQSDEADAAIRRGIVSPVLVVGRVVCVWTPRKAGR
jgi:hypothetical protein